MGHLATTDEPNQQSLQLVAYTLSRARIAEQVIINVLSALAIGSLAAVSSLLLLLYQRLAHYIVVPTNVLMAIVFVGLGAVLMLVVVAVAAYLAIGVAVSRNSAVAIGLLVGLIGWAFASGAVKISDVTDTMRKAREEMTSDSGQHRQSS